MSLRNALRVAGTALTRRQAAAAAAAAALLPSSPRICGWSGTPAPRRCVGAYDNDGKTYVSMLNNNNIGEGIMIAGYTQFGFRLNNNFMVLGPVVCFANTVMAWYVNDERDVCEGALSLLLHLEPPPSIIVLGIGDDTYRRQVDRTVLAAARKHGRTVEVLPVDAALATYNFVVSEGRHAAGAFIPPRFIPVVDDDVITTSARHMQVYGEDLPQNDVWVDDEEHEQRVHANYKEFAGVLGAQQAAEAELRAKLKPRGGDGGDKKIGGGGGGG